MFNLLLLVLLSFLAVIVLVCLLWGKKLSELPIIIESTKLGIKLNTNTLTLLILAALLIGFFIVVRGVNDYQGRELKLKTELDEAKTKISAMETSLERFRSYAVLFRLVFPETPQVSANAMRIQIYICKQGEGSPRLTEGETMRDILNDIWVKVENLNPGDKLKIIAQGEDGKAWESSGVVEIPKSDLYMRKVS